MQAPARVGLAAPRTRWAPPRATRRPLRPPSVLKHDAQPQAQDDGGGAKAAGSGGSGRSGGAAADAVLRQRLESLLGPSLAAGAVEGDGGLASTASGAGGAGELVKCAAGCVLAFSYGANLHFATLQRRGVRPLAREPAFVVDTAVRMRFRHRGGYATLERMPLAAESGGSSPAGAGGSSSPGSSARCTASGYAEPPPAARGAQAQQAPQQQQQQPPRARERPRYPPLEPHVHGVLYVLRAEDLDKLRRAEGGYVLRDIEVQTYDGRRAVAQAFVSGPLALLPAEVAPTERYMRALRDGAADNYLDPLHQARCPATAWLSSVQTVSSAGLGPEYFNTPSRFVAYGFLLCIALLVVGFFAQH